MIFVATCAGFAWQGMSVPTHLTCRGECPELTLVSVTVRSRGIAISTSYSNLSAFVTRRREIVVEVSGAHFPLPVHHHNVR